MKALIISGEELLRISLKEIIATAGNFTSIIEAGTEHEFLSKTANQRDITFVILHPESLKNQDDDWVKLVRRLYPGVSILLIAADDATYHNRWMGISALTRSSTAAHCIETIRKILRLPKNQPQVSDPERPRRHTFMQNEFSRFQDSIEGDVSQIDLSTLSYRQKQILAMAADGLPNKEIAARLSIAEGTVKAHMHAIFKVLGVSNRTQAVIRYGASGNQIMTRPAIPTQPQTPQPVASAYSSY